MNTHEPKTEYLYQVGIVDGVKAIRKDKTVLRLEATVRIETEYETSYYGDEPQIDTVLVSLPVDSGVNPGDIATVSMSFVSPDVQRFVPALEVGSES